MKKRCTKCGEKKELEELTKDRRTSTGRASRCKDCDAKKAKAYVKSGRYSITTAQYRGTPEGRAKVRVSNARYRRSEGGKKAGRAAYHRQRARNPARLRAKDIYLDRVRRGKICRVTTCTFVSEDCHKIIHAHHPDYSKPLEVIGVCLWHHRLLHALAELPQHPYVFEGQEEKIA